MWFKARVPEPNFGIMLPLNLLTFTALHNRFGGDRSIMSTSLHFWSVPEDFDPKSHSGSRIINA